ncbi:BON domain-containing protein [Alysiella filiformis]|uniref:Osmotically-inducible protein OsmY, contains BON domain n=1 Tax=Alysiella filiformis DSM 16848 TaxID=1120981 RepID=A0A286ECX5_9NEIS|nr:BON domain-containing protein [Alysiella filiformis]QMT31924.1 BON domain-containing protein [Alysiella filiformis]UBQ57169.1 BON domain-containing protein [Alysiella filiformis DSM 16848]SOD68772.1 Osmotically-inducible protein OsmY, contains BON domain [Alysiella filiformis DSM 16848]
MKRPHFPYPSMIAAVLLAAGLSGCAAGIIGGGAAVASVADRRSGGSQADDEVMEQRIKSKAQALLRKNSYINYTPHVAVTSYNRRILLTGQVASTADSQLAEQIARSEQSALSVYNYITVSPINRSVVDVSNDTAITARVRANLLGISHVVYPGHVKVVTYGGITYVMGILTPAQQAAVTHRVSTTAGVLRVVTLFEEHKSAY